MTAVAVGCSAWLGVACLVFIAVNHLLKVLDEDGSFNAFLMLSKLRYRSVLFRIRCSQAFNRLLIFGLRCRMLCRKCRFRISLAILQACHRTGRKSAVGIEPIAPDALCAVDETGKRRAKDEEEYRGNHHDRCRPNKITHI